MSSPLRHRSPVKDAEVGPTPQKTNNVTSPASAPAAAPSTGIRGFVARNKKLLVVAGVIGAVVLIAASVKGSQNAAARANANALNSDAQDPSAGSPSDSGTGDNTPTKAPSIYDTPSTAEPTEADPDATEDPTLPPTPEILPLFTPVCNLTGNLGRAPYFNAIFFDTFWSNGSSCEGRLGVQNHAWVNKFGVGNGMFTPPSGCPTADSSPQFRAGDYAFIVGGGLTLNDTTIDNGGLAYKYEEVDVNITYWNTQSGCQKIQDGNVVEFGVLQPQLRTASNAIAAMSTPLSVTSKPDANTLQFTLNESIMTEYFVVQEADLVGVSVFKLVGTPKTFRGKTATIIINIVMDEANADGSLIINNWSTQGFGADLAKNIVWNFKGYQTLSFQQGSWFGTILALDASFETCIGDFYGGVFAQSWNTKHKQIQYKFHEARFQGLVFTTECT